MPDTVTAPFRDCESTAAAGNSQPFRNARGGVINHARTINFSFDGRRYAGHPGDTLASALLANGVRLVGRSFKYHRPRGILSAGSEEPNALVELRTGARTEPNTRATTVELFDGLEATSQNAFPSLRFDAMSLASLLSPLLSAGFYYKTFMWPASFWEKLYEPMIRRAAGLGTASGLADPDHYDRGHAFCDVLVIGSGPAGLMAALAAARTGARVILVEEDAHLGGRALCEDREIGGLPAALWVAGMQMELETHAEVRVLSRTTVFGVYDNACYGAIERVSDHLAIPNPHQPRQRLWKIVATRTVLAAGAIERPLLFDGNDRPGVMLAGSVRSYVNKYGVAPARRAVVFANNDDAARTVADLAAAGVAVQALVDPREQASPAVRRIAAQAGAIVLEGAVVERAHGGAGGVHAVRVRDRSGRRRVVHCDLLAMSGGWDPTLHLATYLGNRPRWDDAIAAFVPDGAPQGMVVAGAAAGEFDLAATLRQGAQAGLEAAEAAGFGGRLPAIPAANDELTGPRHGPVPAQGRAGGVFVDFQNDVTVKDVQLASREGFHAVEHLKRYTTLGMATDQGKTGNVNGLAVMAELRGRSIPQTGTTGYRPPFVPVAIGALAGPHRGAQFRPIRFTPTHGWASEQGAAFVAVGQWMRAQHFSRPGEDWLAAVTREVNAVRAGVGFCDVSTLGKIDVQGADAGVFLDRICANDVGRTAVGRISYALLLREDGFVRDDGTIARLAPDHYIMTASTAHAGEVYRQLEYGRQVLWPELDVQLASVTEQWAQIALAGPRARAVLHRLVDPGHDVSRDAFPFLSARDLTVCGGIRARLFGISFSGEVAFELAVPARFGDGLVREMMRLGVADGITPYGTEALGVMRVEKGYPAGGEFNGQVSAHDLGLQKLLSTRKDYVGRVMAMRPALVDPRRPTLVGLRPLDPAQRLRSGAHLLPAEGEAIARNDQGYVTSAAFSPTLGHWIGLGYLAHGPERHGEVVRVHDPVRGEGYLATVGSPAFVDPEGMRVRG